MRERISILADFRNVVRALKLDTDAEFEYLFVVTPSQTQHNDDEWEGELKEVKKELGQFSSRIEHAQNRLSKRQISTVQNPEGGT